MITRKKSTSKTRGLRRTEAWRSAHSGNTQLSLSLSVLYAELARAQHERDREGIAYIKRAINEAVNGIGLDSIDEPLTPMKSAKGLRTKR